MRELASVLGVYAFNGIPVIQREGLSPSAVYPVMFFR